MSILLLVFTYSLIRRCEHTVVCHIHSRYKTDCQHEEKKYYEIFLPIADNFLWYALYQRIFYLFPAHRSNPPYHSSSSAETLFVLISLWRTAPSLSFITWSAMFFIASLCVTMIMVFPYFLLTSSMSFKISFEVL